MRKGRPKVKTEVRREQITQTVFDIIATKGVKGLTTSAIARNNGMSEANLYRHFKNKSEILESAVNKIGEGLLRNLETVQSATSWKPMLKLRRLFELHLKFIESNKGISRFVYSEEMHMDYHLRGILFQIINGYMSGINRLIKEGQAQWDIHGKIDPQTLALSMIGIIQMITMRWSLKDFSFSIFDEGMSHWKNYARCISAK